MFRLKNQQLTGAQPQKRDIFAQKQRPLWPLAINVALTLLPLNSLSAERSLTIVHGINSPTDSSGSDSLRYRQYGVACRNNKDSLPNNLAYRYTPMQLDVLDPFTNGHLHQLETIFEALKSRLSNERGTAAYFGWRTKVYAGVSSNMLKKPDLINIHSFDASADAFRVMPIRRDSQWLLGVSANRHFNRFRVYPNIGFQWQHNAWTAELKIPRAEIHYQLHPDIKLTATASREGKRWHVYNEDLSRDSEIGLVTKGVNLGAAYRISRTIKLTADIGYQRYQLMLPKLAVDSNNQPRGRLREILLGVQFKYD